MTNLHEWEEIENKPRPSDGLATQMHRMRVPNGWLYLRTLMHRGGLHESTLFVPDGGAERL